MNRHSESGKWSGHFAYIAESALWDFTERLVTLVQAAGMTKSELASRAGMRPSQVTRILSGDHNMTVTTMAKLAAALGAELQIGLSERAKTAKRTASRQARREKPRKDTRAAARAKPVAAAPER